MTTDIETKQSDHSTIPETMPVLPLKGTVVLPLAIVPLGVGQERSVRLVDEAMRGDRLVAVVLQRDENIPQAGPNDVYRVGTAVAIQRLLRSPDGTVQLIVQGIERVRLVEFIGTDPYLVARVEAAPDAEQPGLQVEGLRRTVVNLFQQLVALIDDLPKELVSVTESLPDPAHVAYVVAATVPLETAQRQLILETDPVDEKLRRLIQLLQHEVAVRRLSQKIASETQEQMTKAQREYVLREQLKAIQRELGEAADSGETGDLGKKLAEAGLPEEARREAERELSRLGGMPPASPEYGMIRTYLDWMVALPWKKHADETIDIERAHQVLDEDHYDLEKVKERILEHLAVKKLRFERAGTDATPAVIQGAVPPPQTQAERANHEPILCFVGPPGVGKTSLGQSIARALGRRFVRMSLGGIHDEAEIRGHRRTYIGAMPGRIVQNMRRAEIRNPIFMLDEVDKVGADWRGDPSSALLEVLDPAQNHTFMDNYLGVAFDLSSVFFICTANTIDTIPPALLDRMEVLRLAGYTENEKLHIAEKYLVPKELSAHGLNPGELGLEEGGIREIIRSYTREAGVRNLDREIAGVCRKVARAVAEGRKEPVRLSAEGVAGYLGKPRFFEELAERMDRPGIATGLAWTPVGGGVLFVEATMMPSRDEQLILTGMLGDVMRESAQAALSYVRSNAEILGVSPYIFSGKTFHLHVPAGAIPKDGPSAGVTMTMALASLITGRPVRYDIAMTGEITLRGKVLPVGGIKEKILAAHQAGIKTIILPRRNERDLDEVPQDVRQELTFVLVDTAEEALEEALMPVPEPVPA